MDYDTLKDVSRYFDLLFLSFSVHIHVCIRAHTHVCVCVCARVYTIMNSCMRGENLQKQKRNEQTVTPKKVLSQNVV